VDSQFIWIFKKIINIYGIEICNNLNILNSLISDYTASDFYKERRALIWILETNCHKTLTPDIDYEEWKKIWIEKLNLEEFIDKKTAALMLEIIFNVLFGEKYYVSRGFSLLPIDTIQADVCFNKAIILDEHSSQAFYGKGIIAMNKNDFDNAIIYFSSSIEYNPLKENPVIISLAKTYDARGDKYKYLNNYSLAISDYKQALNLKLDFTILLKLAKCYNAIKDFNNEICCYVKAIAMEPSNSSLLINRAEAYMNIGGYDNAILDYNTVLKKDDKYQNGYERRSYAYYKIKNYKKALEDCDMLLSIEPMNSQNLYHQGLIYFEMNDFVKARKSLLEANKNTSVPDLSNKILILQNKVDVNESKYYENIGDCHLAKNRYKDARFAYSKSLELNSINSSILIKRGNIYKDISEFELAKRDYQMAIKHTNDPLEKATANGFVDLIDKNYQGVIEHLVAAIDLNGSLKIHFNPILFDAYKEEGIYNYKRNNFDKAINYFLNAVEINSDDECLNQFIAKSYYGKGLKALENKDYDIAIDCFTRTIDFDISFKEKIQFCLADVYFKRGDNFKEKGDLKLAMVDYEYALKIRPNSEIYMRRADIYILNNELESAYNDYNIIINNERTNIKAYIKIMYILFLQRKYEDLPRICKTILKIDPNNDLAYYICDNTDSLKDVNKRESWENSTSYHGTTIFPFNCSNCQNFIPGNSTCNIMVKAHIFALTYESSRCQKYIKNKVMASKSL
jgi:tetratricopeptide (TPR) repeat protein